MGNNQDKLYVQTNVKDESLIELRREQIVSGALKLFKEKGFHKATTREIAKAAGFSIGTLYEYIRTKEDVLYLVCDSIYNKVMDKISAISTKKGTVEELENAIAQYFLLIDSMVDEFTIMYQESKTLSKEALHYVLKKELEMVELFENILNNCVEAKQLNLTKEEVYIAANHIVVQGQSWAFRKWALHKQFTIEQFIKLQTKICLDGIKHIHTK